MAVVFAAKRCLPFFFHSVDKNLKADNECKRKLPFCFIREKDFLPETVSALCNMTIDRMTGKLQSGCHAMLPSRDGSSSRRLVLVCGGASLLATLTFSLTAFPVWAEEKSNGQEEKDDEGFIGPIKSLFDPNEKTKSGKVLPKAYLKSAREVVKTLRESLKEDPKDIAKFRRTADAAKESIRDYLSNWKGQQTVVREESYAELEKAIRSLASFYSKAGPSAALPEEIKSEILSDLNTAEEFL